jgi:hypothetical protein
MTLLGGHKRRKTVRATAVIPSAAINLISVGLCMLAKLTRTGACN